MKKIAIVVHANKTEGAQALHGLLYAQEAHEAGYQVQLIFDGAGTYWIEHFENPDHPYHPIYKAVKKLDVIAGVCEFCAVHYGNVEAIKQSGLQSLGETKGHPSLVKLLAEDYQIITL